MIRFSPRKLNSFFNKLFIASLMTSLIIYTGLLVVSLNTSRSMLYEQKSKDMTLLVENINRYVEIYYQNVSSILYSVRNSEGFLKGNNEVKEKILQNHVNANSIVGNIFFVDASGQVVASNALIYEIVGQPQLEMLYRFSLKNLELSMWSEPYYSPMQTSRTIAASLPVKNNKGQLEGVIIVELNTNWLSRQISTFLSDRAQTIVVVSPEGDVISFDSANALLPFVRGELPVKIDPDFLRQINALTQGVHSVKLDNRKLMAVKSQNNRLRWQLVSLSDENLFTQNIRELSSKFERIGLISLVFLLASSFVLSRHFAKPVRVLAHKMDYISGEKLMLTPYTPLRRNDEIGMLSVSFHSMIRRIRELIENTKLLERKKQTMEYKMLMSQIRPHFLYNTLNSIRNLARNQRSDEIDETIRSLMQLLTFSIDKKDDLIVLEEELACVKAYVQISQVRNGKIIDVFSQIPPDHLVFQIPKLILQPLIENSIFHGFGKQDAGLIVIQSLVQGNDLLISITDNGKGLPATELERLVGKNTDGIGHAFNSIGLSNVHERIKLLFGASYGLLIPEQPKTGSKIMVHIPAVPSAADLHN